MGSPIVITVPPAGRSIDLVLNCHIYLFILNRKQLFHMKYSNSINDIKKILNEWTSEYGGMLFNQINY